MAGNGIRTVNIDDASCEYSTEGAALYPSSAVNGPLNSPHLTGSMSRS